MVDALRRCGLPVLVAALACAPAPSDPRALFERATESIEQSTVFEYDFVARDDGDPSLEGRAILERLDLSGSRYRVRVTGRDGDGRAFDVSLDGIEVRSVEADEGAVRVSPLAAAGPILLARVQPALMYPFFDPRSLAGEAGAALVTAEGRDRIGHKSCEVVRVTYDDDEEDSRWCFGTDGLPRRMEWIAPEGSETLEISNLTTDRPPPAGTFRLPTPPGFAERQVEIGPPRDSLAAGWSLPRLGGGQVTLAELRGRVVLLDFWATWCPPCVESLPALEKLLSEFADKPVSIFAVNTMESGDPEAFLRERRLSIPVLLEGDEVHARSAPGNLPAFVVIDPRGRHAGFGLGYWGELTEDHARRLIERALNSDSPAP